MRRGDAFYGTERDFEQHMQIERTMNETTNASIIPIWRAIARQFRMSKLSYLAR